MSLSGKKAELRDLYDRFAAHQRRRAAPKRFYHRYVEKLVHRLVPEPRRVLDIGCGNGDLLASLSPRRGLGVDFSGGMVALAAERHAGLEFRQCDAETLELDEKFDTVLMVNLLGHLDDIYAALQKTRGAMDARGRLVVVYYNHLWEPLLRLASLFRQRAPIPHENWLPLPEIENLLKLTDYEVVRSGRRMLCPAPIPGLAWVLNTAIAPLPLVNAFSLIQYVVARPAPMGTSGADWSLPEQGPTPERVPTPIGTATEGSDLTCSVVIPAKDEKGNIEDAIRRTAPMGQHTEYIFVDGHSTDGTVEEIERVTQAYPDRDIKFAYQDGKGKADAVRKGFDMATGDVLMILDSDLTMPPEDLPQYFEVIASGKAEFVNGCRLVYPMEKEAMRSLNKIANHIFGRLFSWLMEQRVRDTLCGTKVLFRRDYERIAANRAYFGDFDPFGDFDLLFGAARLNLKIVDLPIRYRERTYGQIKIHRFRHGLLLLKMSVFGARKLKFF